MILFEESTVYEKENSSWGYEAQVQKLTPPFISYVILDSHLLSGDGHSWSWLSNGIPGAGQVRWINSPCKSMQQWSMWDIIILEVLFFHFIQAEIHKLSIALQFCFFLVVIYTPLLPAPPNFWSVCVIQDTDIIESNKQGHMDSNQVTKARRIRRNCKHENSLSVLAVRTEGSHVTCRVFAVWLRDCSLSLQYTVPYFKQDF